MRFKRKALTYSVCAAVLCSAASGANAACTWGGAASNKWYLYLMQGATPAIKSTTVTVKNGSNVNQQIKVFQNIATPFENETTTVIKCLLTVSSTGVVSASPCNAWIVGGATHGASISGKLNSTGATTASATACDFTGTLNVVGDPTAVTIRAGHVIGTNGAGVATQGPSQAFHFSLVKF
jgi:hypothetical protein